VILESYQASLPAIYLEFMRGVLMPAAVCAKVQAQLSGRGRGRGRRQNGGAVPYLEPIPGRKSLCIKETGMTLERFTTRTFAGVIFSLLSLAPNPLVRLMPVASAQEERSHCEAVGGALMTNIGAIAGVTNLGPVSGDLAGSVAATILGQNSDGTFNVQHYWVTAGGETITLKKAVLKPTFPTSDPAIVAVPWGNYRSDITGGSGKFKGATGYIDYFGIADFHQNTLVLRYRGEVCYEQ
jgi:hypothetical protein